MTTAPNTVLNDTLARELATNISNITAGVSSIREQAAAQAAQIKTLVESSGQITQLRADVDSIVKRYDEIKAAMENVAKSVRRSSAAVLGLPGAEDEVENFSMLRLSCAIAKGDWSLAPKEKGLIDEWVKRSTHVADANARGGTFVPDFVIGDVIGAIYAKSAWINLDGQGEGETMISVINGVPGLTGSIPKVIGGVVSYWVGEEDEIAASATSTGDLTYALRTLGNLCKITQRMREYGSIGFEAFFRNDMVRSMVAKIDKTIPYGSGTQHAPKGFMKTAGYTGGPQVFSAKKGALCDPTSTGPTPPGTNSGAEINFDHLDEMIGLCEDADLGDGSGANAAFIFHPRTKRRVKQIKVDNFSGQSSGQPYLLGLPRLPDSRLQEVIGPFATTTAIPTKQTAGQSVGWTAADPNVKRCSDVFYSSSWSETVLIRGQGVRVEDDGGKGKSFAAGIMYVKMTGDFDVLNRRPENIVVCPDGFSRN